MEDAPAVLRFYRDWIADAPDELMTIPIQRRAPAVELVPPELRGELVIVVACCYSGPIEEGEAILRPLREFGSPVLDGCVPKPYVEHQGAFDAAYRHGWHYYFRSCDVGGLTDDVIDVMVDQGSRIESPISSVALWQMGGAVARVGEAETAFNGRDAAYTFNINGNSMSPDGADAEREWARAYWSALEPHHTSVYVNFLMDEGEDRIRAAYGADRYDRLKALKRAHDPENVFRLNQNIAPD
jgi:hypothetical protein